MTDVIQVLLMEDNPGDARLLRLMLEEVTDRRFQLHCVERLSEALEYLDKGGIDVALLDLFVPDSEGLETFQHVHQHAPHVPMIVLTGLNDNELAVRAVRAGAQDYLVKGQVDGNLLARAIRYAIERHQMQTAIRGLLLIDEMTGLYNRRGFLTLAEQQMKLARRTSHGLAIVFMDMDGLKNINDSFGHSAGDAAIREISEILRNTFRESDILARIGGDEFVALTPNTTLEPLEIVITRLQENLEEANLASERKFLLSVSVGMTRYDSTRPCTLEELLAEADKKMYDSKRAVGKSR